MEDQSFMSLPQDARREAILARLEQLASRDFVPSTRAFDGIAPTKALQRQLLELQVERMKNAPAARRQMLGETAFAGTNPTPEEAQLYQPGRPIDSMLGTTGASITADPAAAQADLQAELRNEELNRAAEANAPQIAEAQRYLSTQDAGFDPAKLYAARKAEAGSTAAQLRLKALSNMLTIPGLDPMVGADVANGRAVSTPKRVKVQKPDGDVYYNEMRLPGGGVVYAPATDTTGQPLRVPASASKATTLQKDTQFISNTLGVDSKEALKLKLTLKSKSPDEAWAALVGQLSKLNYGRLAKDPEKLRATAEAIWHVARPGQPVPNGAGQDAASGHKDVRDRAAKEGYSNLGNWIEGRGFEVLDESGRVIGHYH